MKQSEFRKWLEAQGVEVKRDTNHLKLYYQGKQTIMPRHLNKKLAESLGRTILKQLGMK